MKTSKTKTSNAKTSKTKTSKMKISKTKTWKTKTHSKKRTVKVGSNVIFDELVLSRSKQSHCLTFN